MLIKNIMKPINGERGYPSHRKKIGTGVIMAFHEDQKVDALYVIPVMYSILMILERFGTVNPSLKFFGGSTFRNAHRCVVPRSPLGLSNRAVSVVSSLNLGKKNVFVCSRSETLGVQLV